MAMVDIPDGTIIAEDMLAVKRPGIGIEPKYIERVVGAAAKVSIRKDDIIARSKIELEC